MQVILLERIRNLGDLGDQVKVKPGFARNFLIPQGKALPANDDNVKVFEARKAELLKNAEQSLGTAKMKAEAVAGLTLTIEALASEEGKLYGSVSTHQIADAATAQGVDIERSQIVMDDVIRETGEFEVHFSFHPDVSVPVGVVVEAAKRA